MMVLADGNNIVMVGFIVDTPDAYVANDLVTPKHILAKARLVDALVPDNYIPGKFILSDNGKVVPDPDAQPDPVPVKQITLEDVVARLTVVESKVPKDATGIEIKP